MTQTTSVLVIGGGSIGERHVRCFLATGRAAVSLCEINDDVRSRLAESYPLQKTWAHLDEALAAPPEAAVVATPAPLHVPMARRLVAAGGHVLIEKPLSTSFEGIDLLESESHRHDRLVALAYVSRHNPGLAAVREFLRRNDFGPPVEVVHTTGQDFPSFRPAYREIYYRSRASGGGAIQDALTHAINAIEWLVGPTTAVAADADHQVLEGVDVEDTVHVVARNGDVMTSYALNQHQPPNETVLSVHCPGGTVRWMPQQNLWQTMARGQTDWQVHRYETQNRDTPFIAQADAFLDAVAGHAPLACPLAEGRQTLATCLAVITAAEEKRWVDVADVK